MEQNPSTCHLAGYSRNPNIASVIAQLKTHQLNPARSKQTPNEAHSAKRLACHLQQQQDCES